MFGRRRLKKRRIGFGGLRPPVLSEGDNVVITTKDKMQKLEDEKTKLQKDYDSLDKWLEGTMDERMKYQTLATQYQTLATQYILKDQLKNEIYKGPTSIVFEYLDLEWRDVL